MSLLLLFNQQTPHYEYLLSSARQLLKENHPEAAVVTAQAACEVYTEQTIADLFRVKNAEYLFDPIDAFFLSYSLKNDKLYDLYFALTNDAIDTQPFWDDFKLMVRLRNDFAHSGQSITADDASRVCDAASKLITHLRSVLKGIVDAAKTAGPAGKPTT